MDPGPMILLVEDNEDDELLMRRAFKVNQFAHDIVVASTGEQAIEWLASTPALPSLVLLDLNLPKMSGLDVLREIRRDQRTHLLPVVILTSSKQDEDVIEGYSLGANAYVRKPVDFAAFAEAVKTLGLFWLVLNEQPRNPR
jgi:two-component system, response regulator